MANIDFTVFGGGGFIGRRLAIHLRESGARVFAPSRNEIASGALAGRSLGNVIYSIGRTADFRTRLSETVEAHVGLLDRLMNDTNWSSWLYVSSTRVYGAHCTGQAMSEDSAISVRPSLDAVYDLSKLLGESLVLARSEPGCRFVRLSNVFGSGMPTSNFLASLVIEAKTTGKVVINESPDSSKDYVPIDYVVRGLEHVALDGKRRSYNLASGIRIEHQRIADCLRHCLDAEVVFAEGGIKRQLPLIDTERFEAEYSGPAHDLENEIENFILTMDQQLET